MKYTRFVNLIWFFFILGSGLLMFFVALSGANTSSLLLKLYWLEADTTGFAQIGFNETRWYDYRLCSVNKVTGEALFCIDSRVAEPFDPATNFGISDAMPTEFIKHRDTYYYLSRVGWSLAIAGLFFIVLSLVPGFFNLLMNDCSTMLIWLAVFTWVSFILVAVSASLYTACYVKAVKAFHDDNRSAKLGVKLFAFIWTSAFMLLVNCIISVVGLSTSQPVLAAETSGNYSPYPVAEPAPADAYAAAAPEANEEPPTSTRGRFFTRVRRNKQPTDNASNEHLA